MRNLKRRARAFWLQTSTDRFYPDFVCRLGDGRILLVEYKGGHLASVYDAREKLSIGNVWEWSGGKRFFAMPSDEDWSGMDALNGAA